MSTKNEYLVFSSAFGESGPALLLVADEVAVKNSGALAFYNHVADDAGVVKSTLVRAFASGHWGRVVLQEKPARGAHD